MSACYKILTIVYFLVLFKLLFSKVEDITKWGNFIIKEQQIQQIVKRQKDKLVIKH